MIYLPLRLAVGLPTAIGTLTGLGVALVTVAPTRLPMWIKYQQVAGLTLMAGAVSLLLVLPNLLAASMANRLGGGHWASFAATFAGTFLIGWLAQSRLLSRGLRVMGGFPATLDFKLMLLVAINCAVCTLAALLMRRAAGG